MASEKQTDDILRDKTVDSEVLPPYALEDSRAGPSTQAQTERESRPDAAVHVPTVTSPFDFPAEAAPSYTESSPPSSSSAHKRRPIAIPQVSATPTAPFLQTYAPLLLARGIPSGTWASFLDTLSAFLAAKVTDRAISHAADVGRQVGNVPKRFGKNVATHAKSVGRGISDNAKKGNLVGAAFGVIGGVISLPVGTAVKAIGAITSLPGAAVGAVAQKPQTPRERAVAYAAAANKKWLESRGLRAQLVDTQELARLVGASSEQILQAARSEKSDDAEAQLGPLRTHISELTIEKPTKLSLGEQTLWLVIFEDV